MIVLSHVIASSAGPIFKVLWTCFRDDLRHTMPCIPRLLRHEYGISRSKPQCNNTVAMLCLFLLGVSSVSVQLSRVSLLLILESNDEDRIATQRYAYKALVTVLTDVSMQAQSVPWAVEIHNRRFGPHVWEQSFHQICNISREGWWLLGRIYLLRPVILSTQSNPAELLVQE